MKTKSKSAAVPLSAYDAAQPASEAAVCRALRAAIDRALPKASSKVWHGAPVWFVGETPVVGYSVPARGGVALLFWNGQAFREPGLSPMGSFKAAQALFDDVAAVKKAPLGRWLKKAGTELWDVSEVRRMREQALAKKSGKSRR